MQFTSDEIQQGNHVLIRHPLFGSLWATAIDTVPYEDKPDVVNVRVWPHGRHGPSETMNFLITCVFKNEESVVNTERL